MIRKSHEMLADIDPVQKPESCGAEIHKALVSGRDVICLCEHQVIVGVVACVFEVIAVWRA